MGILPVSSSSTIYSSANVQNKGKTSAKATSPQASGDLVPYEAINDDFKKCAPLYEVERSRVYYAIPDSNGVYGRDFSVWIKPMLADSSKYVLGTKNDRFPMWVPSIKDLDLGTRLLHLVQINNAPWSPDTINNEYLLPGDSNYTKYVQEMIDDIAYTKDDTYPHYAGVSDSMPFPDLQRPYEFMQCVYLTVGVKEPAKNTHDAAGGVEIYQAASGEIKIRFNASGNDRTSIKIFDITGKLVSNVACNGATATWNASKATSGMYECVIENGNTLTAKKILITK